MGLDQFAYSATRAGQRSDYFEAEYGDHGPDNTQVAEPKELAYWRKHPNLQGWMERLWFDRGMPGGHTDDLNVFNGVELELTWDDLERLEQDIKSGAMSKLNTVGFFFGEVSDDYYRDQDLKFVREAKAEVFLGLKVFYNSSW